MPSQFGGAVDTNSPVFGLMNSFGPANNKPFSGYNSLTTQQQTEVNNSTFYPVQSSNNETGYMNANGQVDIVAKTGGSNPLMQALGLAADVAPVAAAVATGGTSVLSSLASGALSQINSNNGGSTNKMATPTNGPQSVDNPQQGVTASTMGDGGGPPAAASSTAGDPNWASLIGSLGGLYTGLQQAYGSGQGSAAQASKLADPFQGSRQQYAQQMNGLMQDPSSVSTLPGYQFQLNQGLGAIRSAGTIQGSGGAENQQAMQFGQGLASTSYQQEFNNLGTLSGATWGPQAGNAAANQLTQGQATGQKAVMGALAGGSGLINSGVNGLIKAFNGGGGGSLPGQSTGSPGDFSSTQGGTAPAWNGTGTSGTTGDYSQTGGGPSYGDPGNLGDPTNTGAPANNYWAGTSTPTDMGSGDPVTSLSQYFNRLGGGNGGDLSSSFNDVLGSMFNDNSMPAADFGGIP